MAHCNYCNQSILFGGQTEDNKLFCSEKCIDEYRNEKSYLRQLKQEGRKYADDSFCEKCLNESTEEPFRGTQSLNGVGTKLVGNNKEKCKKCGSTIKSLFPSMGLESKPLKSYRLIKTGRNEYVGRALRNIHEPHIRNIGKILLISVIAIILFFTAAFFFIYYTTYPSDQEMKAITEMVIENSFQDKLEKLDNGNYLEVLTDLPEKSRNGRDEFLKGYAQYGLKRYKQAWKTLKNAARMDPALPQPVYLCGIMLEERKKYKRALKMYEESIKRDPKYDPAINALKSLKKKLKK